jgi:signal transduction histidine kinase
VGIDDAATRRELVRLLRDQAEAVRATVGAAARANQQAAQLAQQQLESRLLDNARLLRDLDAKGQLDERLLDEVTRRHGLFRANVLDAQGRFEFGSRGEARAGHRPGLGRGFGRGGGAARLVAQVLAGAEEATTGLHRARWDRGARMAVAVRRSGGGAIVLNVDATTLDTLGQSLSLETVLKDVVDATPEVAYVVFTRGDEVIARGDEAPPAAASAKDGHGEREVEYNGHRFLEVSGPVSLQDDDVSPATLRLGMSLLGVQRAHWRMLGILALSLVASLALASLGVGATWLRRRYALLSADHERAEAALRRRDRLAAMGELAASVAHEVRNPLNAIAMSAQRLRREVVEPVIGEDHPARAEGEQLLQLLASETARINRIVEQFLEFARPPKPAPVPTGLAALLGEAAAAAREIGDGRGVRLDVQVQGAGEAQLDRDQMRQALDNLLRNAIEATPAGGTVRLEGRTTDREHTIAVEDSGPGISPDVLPRIFDLYYTTKAGGTGVGLAVTQRIVTAHDGTIEVESAPEHGTRMTIRLPRRQEVARG